MNELMTQICSMNQQLLNEFGAGNAAALVSSYYDEDASLVTPDGNVLNGLTSITNFFGVLVQNSQNRIDVRPLFDSEPAQPGANPVAGASGDLVCVLGEYVFALGQEVETLPLANAAGRRVVVFRRHANGLKAVIDIFG